MPPTKNFRQAIFEESHRHFARLTAHNFSQFWTNCQQNIAKTMAVPIIGANTIVSAILQTLSEIQVRDLMMNSLPE
jgi:hypothetical protein